MAWETNTLEYDPNYGGYFSKLTPGDMYHNRETNTSGGIGEFHFGYSENYMNKFYYGASLGIRRFNYNEEFRHNERLLDTIGTTLRSFDYSQNLETVGTGFNFKLGFLYLLSDFFRFGFAFENEEVANQFRTVLNTRIGIEYMLLTDFFVRGGYALLPQPFKQDVGNLTTPNQTFSGGIGLKFKNMNLDLSYRLVKLNTEFYAFDPSKIENRTEFNSSLHNIFIAFNLKF